MTVATREVLLDGHAGATHKVAVPVKANQVIRKGWLVAADATGFLVVVTTATGLKGMGIALQDADSTGLANGAILCDVQYGVEVRDNHGADLVVQADLFAKVFAVDNNTVAKTDGTGTRSAAGIFVGFADDGRPLVLFRPFITGL